MERPPVRQDSPAPVVEDAPPVAGLAEAPPGALAKLGRLVPGADVLVRFAYRTAAVSAASAALVVAAVLDRAPGLVDGPGGWALALAAFAVLCVPALAAALVGWTLSDLVRLPGHLRQAAVAAAGGAAGAVAAGGSRLVAIVRALWAARGLALGSRDAWLRAVAAARFLRLASLPFALALVGLFALNAVVVLCGAVALVALVL